MKLVHPSHVFLNV